MKKEQSKYEKYFWGCGIWMVLYGFWAASGWIMAHFIFKVFFGIV